jgi:hypothetical protein
MVNRGDQGAGDRFMPLMFQARKGPNAAVEDLYNDAFGKEPDLSFVLGDKAKANNFYKYDLATLSTSKPSDLTADQQYEKKKAEMIATNYEATGKIMPTTADFRQAEESVDMLLAEALPSVED